MAREELIPPRLGRNELFFVAERYLERQEPVIDTGQPDRQLELLASNSLFSVMALGRVIGGFVTTRSNEAFARQDIAILRHELGARDLDDYRSIMELAQAIVSNERLRRD